ncbi:MAG TPA: DUF4230 domain-containing protein [Phycisphaerales bacterium]|nr:DUF4230 domain-containing protein [Phycisphaerales bacterium]
MFTLAIALIGVVAGAAVAVVILRPPGKSSGEIRTEMVAESVRKVGRVVGLEVRAKEIATSTRGISWLPPIILSQAKLAMIFHFEKQYFIDLARLNESNVEPLDSVDDGGRGGRFRVTLPPVEGSLRLTDVRPYDIQAGRVLGLFDVIQMNAATQTELMRAAQEEAATVFAQHEPRYHDECRRSIEAHLESIAKLLNVRLEVVWPDSPAPAEPRVELAPKLRRQLTLVGG